MLIDQGLSLTQLLLSVVGENFSTEDFSSPENVFLEVADLQKTKSSFFNRLTTTTTATTTNKNVVHCPHQPNFDFSVTFERFFNLRPSMLRKKKMRAR